MGFLGIGTGEIILILILALIILGPGRITGFARTLGKTVRAIKKASSDLSNAVSRELETTDKPATPSKDDRPDKPGEASAPK